MGAPDLIDKLLYKESHYPSKCSVHVHLDKFKQLLGPYLSPPVIETVFPEPSRHTTHYLMLQCTSYIASQYHHIPYRRLKNTRFNLWNVFSSVWQVKLVLELNTLLEDQVDQMMPPLLCNPHAVPEQSCKESGNSYRKIWLKRCKPGQYQSTNIVLIKI